ncbi:hypothetical protein CAPTEDRAFT_187276 [Capitella teleta]|uniref:Uncharacterized protein n=1 Tax=Capitella teleta TaxID=283909 RepID=X1ZK36_CAPTE|nr:hypothetical protein CAPTEDRAFT_187276 [Capitella teleta]|eukprot:ELU10113.1 hypothetical protein CAPTEDRAFT_187276 [Capitella teleta]
MEAGGDFRSRSNSGGIRGLFKRRQKSGDVSGGGASPETVSPVMSPSQQGSSSKMKQFFEHIRPRSKSDATAMQHMRRPHVDLPVSSQPKATNDSTSPGAATPMSAILAQRTRHLSTVDDPKASSSIGPEHFLEMYRQRAYSDPRSSARMAALAARRKKEFEDLGLPLVPENPNSPPTHPEVDFASDSHLPRISDSRTDRSAWEMKWREKNNNDIPVVSVERGSRSPYRGVRKLFGRLSRSPDARSTVQTEEEMPKRRWTVSADKKAVLKELRAKREIEKAKKKVNCQFDSSYKDVCAFPPQQEQPPVSPLARSAPDHPANSPSSSPATSKKKSSKIIKSFIEKLTTASNEPSVRRPVKKEFALDSPPRVHRGHHRSLSLRGQQRVDALRVVEEVEVFRGRTTSDPSALKAVAMKNAALRKLYKEHGIDLDFSKAQSAGLTSPPVSPGEYFYLFMRFDIFAACVLESSFPIVLFTHAFVLWDLLLREGM